MMYLVNLSASIFQLCDTQQLNFKAASGLCNLSLSHFTSIVQCKTTPSIRTLEKICIGFRRTPNDLLIPSGVWKEVAYRERMQVTQIRCFHFSQGLTSFPVCPRCGRTMEREYQSYCDRCGQCLDWRGFSKAAILPPQR